jgi:hypothetical protein
LFLSALAFPFSGGISGQHVCFPRSLIDPAPASIYHFPPRRPCPRPRRSPRLLVREGTPRRHKTLLVHPMPAKYSHVKKRTASGLKRKSNQSAAQPVHGISVDDRFGHVNGHRHSYGHGNGHSPNYKSNPLVDRSLSQAMLAVAHLEPAISGLERSIARILLIRYEHDIARLFSTRIYALSLVQLPTFVMRCLSLGGPSWLAWNCNSEEMKDFFRAVLAMDMRQAGERVATKSVLWSYTALRQFVRSRTIAPGILLNLYCRHYPITSQSAQNEVFTRFVSSLTTPR